MLRLLIFTIVVGAIFVGSPARQPGPVLDVPAAPAATAAAILGAVAGSSPRSALEAARLAEGARQMAHERIEQARRAFAPPARP